jgi:hypothetical protein
MKTLRKNIKMPDAEQVRAEAMQTIVQQLGVAKAAFFIRETLSGPTDYLKLKSDLFKGLTTTEIYEQIKAG